MFELLEHPADIGFRAFGETREELFANAAGAMLSIACEIGEVEPRCEYELSATGGDDESRLVNWLSEVLYWFDGKRIALREFRVTFAGGDGLRAAARGEPWDAARHRSKLIVKAVTWHQLRIARHNGGWMAEVYLDI
ncbi:MAG TPA: archease [Bryobacteraceae bacterium]|nr:archease [Bryobacteraceae bacterium]